MSSISRQTAREGLAGLLSTALVGAGKPAEAVYAYQVGDFAGQSPVVVVSSGPMNRLRDTLGDCYRSVFELRIDVFVVYAGEGWTEQDAENAIDTIEALIADVLLANTRYTAWDRIAYADATQTDGVEIGGVEYRRELIRLNVEVF